MPLAVWLRRHGYDEKAIRAAQRCAARQRARGAELDEPSRRVATAELFRALWLETSDRLRSRRSSDILADARLLRWLDSELKRLEPAAEKSWVRDGALAGC